LTPGSKHLKSSKRFPEHYPANGVLLRGLAVISKPDALLIPTTSMQIVSLDQAFVWWEESFRFLLERWISAGTFANFFGASAGRRLPAAVAIAAAQRRQLCGAAVPGIPCIVCTTAGHARHNALHNRRPGKVLQTFFPVFSIHRIRLRRP